MYRRLLVAITLLVMAGCSSTSSNNASTSPGTVSTPAGLTITIDAHGVASPRTLTIAAGSQVTFVNNDSIVHEMFSDPHPEHTDCPELDQVGFLSPGQVRQSGNLNISRDCGFHDHLLPLDANLKGTITIH